MAMRRDWSCRASASALRLKADLAAFLDHLGNEEKEQRPMTMSKPPMSASGPGCVETPSDCFRRDFL